MTHVHCLPNPIAIIVDEDFLVIPAQSSDSDPTKRTNCFQFDFCVSQRWNYLKRNPQQLHDLGTIYVIAKSVTF